MTRCTRCQTAVPAHTTFFAASGEVCERCHTHGELADRAAFEAGTHYDTEEGVELGPLAIGAGWMQLDLGSMGSSARASRWPASGGAAQIQFSASSGALVVALVVVVVGWVAPSWTVLRMLPDGGPQAMVGLGMLTHGWLWLTAALHLLFNRRLSAAKTAAWAGALVYSWSLGLFAYVVAEMVFADEAAAAARDELEVA